MNINEPRHGGWLVIPFLNDKKHHRKVGTTASGRPSSLKSNRLPFLGWIPDEVKILRLPVMARPTKLILYRHEIILLQQVQSSLARHYFFSSHFQEPK
jgi:hypothetical protein